MTRFSSHKKGAKARYISSATNDEGAGFAASAHKGSVDEATLFDVLQRVQRPLRLDDILRITAIGRRDKKKVLALLDALYKQGRIARLSGGRWAHAAKLRTLTGVLSVHRSGAGLVTLHEDARAKQKFTTKNVIIPRHHLANALPGDIVEILLEARRSTPKHGTPHRHKAPQMQESLGRIVRVLEHASNELTVQVVRRLAPHAFLCQAAWQGVQTMFSVDTSSLSHDPTQDELLRVIPKAPQENSLRQAVTVASLGHEDSVAVQEALTRLNHGIPQDFSALELTNAHDVASAYNTLTDHERLAARTDLRHLPFVTIDGSDARDFDDAIYVEKQAQGWLLWVAIADVAHFVRPHSALDKEAKARGNSYYFPQSVTPMLPELLSNDLCSLRPNEDRVVMAVSVQVSAKGVRGKAEPCAAIIRSKARLTYEEVEAFFEGQTALADPALGSMLSTAQDLASALQKERAKRGGLDLDLPETRFILSEQGRVTKAVRRERLISHRLIEACMLAANEAVAEWLHSQGLAFPLRVHPYPTEEKLNALFRTLHTIDLAPELAAIIPARQNVRTKDERPSPKHRFAKKAQQHVQRESPTPLQQQNLGAVLQKLLDSTANTPQGFIVARLVLRSLMQASYSPFEDIHFGIASTAYCHFTSPIRRYADILVHRAVKSALGLEATATAAHKLVAVCEECTTHERAAQAAEREIARRLACLLLQGREGESFSGTISGVSAFGFFVELHEMPVEGLVPLTSLEHDWFLLDEERHMLIGKTSQETYRLGDTVSVKLLHVHVGRLEITFTTERSKKRASKTKPKGAFRKKRFA